MGQSYWERQAVRRLGRRRLLGTSAAFGAGAASLALVGCGDDDDDGGSVSLATPTPGANASPTATDPFANAKKGGTYNLDATGDPPSIDPYGNTSFLTKEFASYAYSRLYKFKAGPGIAAADVKPTPDLAQKAEASADGLKWTITLKPNAKFHDVAPVNGRAVTTDDVKFSWGRLVDPKHPNASQVDFVDKVEFPDPTTMVFTLKAPNVAFLEILSDTNLFWVMPTESGGKFDPAKTSIGSGPWLFDSYTPAVGHKWKRNPNWHENGFPLMDAVQVSIIPEYANRLAQFRAGNTDSSGLSADDLVDVKQRSKDVVLVGTLSQQNSYVYFDSDPAAPWRDPRVRQAISMALDREALNDLGFSVTKLRSAGLDVKSGWNNVIPAGMTRFWLDPKSSAHGETGKFFAYNVAEAKKLLSAAGFANGFPAVWQYAGNRYGKDFNDIAEASGQYLTSLGLQMTFEVQDYNSKYITQTSIGNFKGIAFGPETTFTEAGSYPIRLYTDNPKNRGKIRDAQLAKLAVDQQSESNEQKRREMFNEIQRINAQNMYYIPSQYRAATSWVAHQPFLKNGDTFLTTGYGSPAETYPYRWKSS